MFSDSVPSGANKWVSSSRMRIGWYIFNASRMILGNATASIRRLSRLYCRHQSRVLACLVSLLPKGDERYREMICRQLRRKLIEILWKQQMASSLTHKLIEPVKIPLFKTPLVSSGRL